MILQPPTGLTSLHAAQLQKWIPPGGSTNPSEWNEVYCGTKHGFGAATFHARCDGRARLLVLVRSQEGGWLFGGYTAVGFALPTGYHADPAAYIFSLTNSLGHPEKLESRHTRMDIYYGRFSSASFGDGAGLGICNNADTIAGSSTITGVAYAASASTTHPMAQGQVDGWLAAEVIAWVV